VLNVNYHPEGLPAVMTERREIEISTPGDDGQYYIDFDMKFTADDKDVLLDRVPIPGEENAKVWGGYAGLSLRFAKEVTDSKVMGFSGAIEDERLFFPVKDTALDVSGMMEGRSAGMALLEHPGNTVSVFLLLCNVSRCPFYFFSPAVLYDRSHLLKGNESMALRYRVAVHSERLEADGLKKQLRQFLNDTKGKRKTMSMANNR
jgi:hypothetical protein